MKLRFFSMAIGSMLAIFALVPVGASASTEFGDTCAGDDPVEEPVTLFEISASANPLPTAAPVSGVITKMKVNLIPAAPSFPVSLKVLRQTGSDTVQIVGEANGTVAGGANSLDARISINAGDRLGFFSPSEALGSVVCEDTSGPSTLGAFEGGGAPGSSAKFASIPTEARVPLAAVIEPDADADGFGDETQDGCPQSAATQTACPPVTLSTAKQVKKGSVVIVVTADTPAPVTVKGVVNLGKGKKANLNGGTKSLAPGLLANFTLKFPKKVKKKLTELSPKKALTLKVNVTGTSVAGQVTTKTLKVKLRGQSKD